MRIKKKYALKESLLVEGLLIDDLNTLTNVEKNILKQLHKKFKDESWWKLSKYDMVDLLMKKWEFPFDISFKLTTIYVNNRDQLFSENKIVTEVIPVEAIKYIIRDVISDYKNKRESTDMGQDLWLEIGEENIDYDMHFWDGWDTFYLFFQPEYSFGKDMSVLRAKYNLIVKHNMEFDLETNKVKIFVSYKLGENEYQQEGDLFTKEYDPPQKLSYETIYSWFANMVAELEDIVIEYKYPAVKDIPEEDTPEEE